MKVYVDDMIVKSIHRSDHIEDLRKFFDALRRHQMKLNPTKCTFGITSGKFLEFLVTKREIEVNPEKIQAIRTMRHPSCKKEVQQLTGRIASLSRFIFRSAKRCLLFFKVLRQIQSFEWSEDYRIAFDKLKEYLENPHLLSKPCEGETLYLYLSASDEAVNSILIQKDANHSQKLIYYTSKVLHEIEIQNPRVQKLIFSLVVATKHL